MIPRNVNIRGRNVPTILIASILVYLIGLIAHCLLMGTLPYDEVQNDYFPAAEAMFTGHTPYKPYNDLAWEYPPLALVVLLIPRLFAGSPGAYQWTFDIEMFLFAALETYLVYKLSKRLRKDHDIVLLINLVLMTVMVINGTLYERFDVVPAVICLASVYLFLEKKDVAAFALIAIGGLVKIYPALMFLVFIIPILAKRDWKRAGKCTAVTAVFGIAILGIFYAMCSGDLMNFITYHSDRGLQIESVAASFINLLAVMGVTDVYASISFGSCNITGTIPDAVSPFIMPILVILILLACYVYFLISKKEDDERNILLFTFVFTILFVLANKVFSGQYIMWLIPPFMMLLLTQDDKDDFWWYAGLMISASLMTAVIMACPMIRMYPECVILLLVRNIVLIVLLVSALKRTCIFVRARESFREGNRLLGFVHKKG